MSSQASPQGINSDRSDHGTRRNRIAQIHVPEKKEVWKEGGRSDENRSPMGFARRTGSRPGHYTLVAPFKQRGIQITVRPGHLSEIDWR